MIMKTMGPEPDTGLMNALSGAALLMVSVEGFSYAEAANILGVPAGTLMSRIARGREELKALLDEGHRRRTIKVVER